MFSQGQVLAGCVLAGCELESEVTMFKDHHISKYFSRVSLLKERNLGVSLGKSNGQSIDVISTGSIGLSEGNSIAVSDLTKQGGLQSGLVGSSSQPRVYLVSDPCYVHHIREIGRLLNTHVT